MIHDDMDTHVFYIYHKINSINMSENPSHTYCFMIGIVYSVNSLNLASISVFHMYKQNHEPHRRSVCITLYNYRPFRLSVWCFVLS
jgi:hypothetical protein